MNYRPMVEVNGREWCGNTLVFATRHEAADNAKVLMWNWTQVTATRVDETDAPVNYRWVDRKLVPEPEKEDSTVKYTAEQLEIIARHFNLFVDQDDDGNVVGNTDANAETGWRPIYADACREAIEAQSNG